MLDRFHYGISRRHLYGDKDPVVDSLLKELATRSIIHVGKLIMCIKIITITIIKIIIS